MSIDEGVDSFIFEALYNWLYAIEVSWIEEGLVGGLDCFPHDAESDEIEAPVNEVGDVVVSERGVGVEAFVWRKVWSYFRDDIDTVELHLFAGWWLDEIIWRIKDNWREGRRC